MYDVEKIRKQFPMLNNNVLMQKKPLVFLDNCSTTFKPQCVIDAELEYYTLTTSNAHRGDYDLSVLMDNKIEEARLAISRFVHLGTGSGTWYPTNRVQRTRSASGVLTLP